MALDAKTTVGAKGLTQEIIDKSKIYRKMLGRDIFLIKLSVDADYIRTQLPNSDRQGLDAEELVRLAQVAASDLRRSFVNKAIATQCELFTPLLS